MKILIFGINYAPELTGIGKYTGEMSTWLADNGHDVNVLTALPYYPEWSIHDDYKKKWWVTERNGKVKVQRCPLYVPKKVTSIKRIVHEFSFLMSTIPYWTKSLFQRKYDLVICISPPFHLAFFPLLYTKLRKSRLLTHIQDLQVDAAKELEMIKNKVALDIMFGLERVILANSDGVSTISPGMMQRVLNKGVNPSRAIMFPNWVDETVIYPLPADQSLRKHFSIADDTRVILYSGNLGEKQGLEVIVEVAKSFRSRPDVLFVISGSGGGKDKLVALVNEAGLTNIKFFPLQPYEKLSSLLAIADIHLVLQKKSASDLVMPSKLTAILAAGGCSIVTAVPGTSLFEIVSKYNIGILVEPESPAALTKAIESALESDLTVYRTNARKYSEQFLSKENILAQLNENLKSLCN